MTQKFIRFFTALITTFVVLGAFASTASARMTYGNGEYTNLCGSGTSATHNTCGGYCNTFDGSCSYPKASVVRYICDGRQTECRSNESDFSLRQSVSGVGCGKTVQIDVFNTQCRDGNDWICDDNDLVDYMVWYSGDCSNDRPNPGNDENDQTCSAYEPVNTQFRKSGENTWISGDDMSSKNIAIGDTVDVNCFAKNGADLLPGAKIEITKPDNSTETKHTSVLRNYEVKDFGSYRFRCYSTTIDACSNTDSFRVRREQAGEEHRSSCQDLILREGNLGTVPATVKFEVEGTDNLGDIQRYRVYYGDGTKEENESGEFSHTYESSGNFTARADVKDSKGNWISSNACESTVSIKARSIESHKSKCSDLFILSGNREESPSTVQFKVTGYDNKGAIQKYKLDFGNGVVKESDGETFEQLYNQPGTYTVKGYIRDSQGNWQGGDGTCTSTVYIETEPLTKQPDTGTPTGLTIFGITSGIIGTVGLLRYRALRA
ncbi:PKD domain-containing protein [Candidatus Woesebacteria bacterium]|nr:PKD domain-containing protein [Candidatus Woesebacteria bacterium]MCD8507571.1 PKD domain-containing protein [Candidatus Woesebacteria bacterium]MCD8527411.1 PKD domain-containing protein [Candidatus Woesebacteria bacterium]MCD8546158.1 PKD domain-containing protein [Candidatus Woesebacteria bacterium]